MAKSVIEMALANIDAQIADLQRAKDIILQSAGDATEDAPKVRKARKPRSKPGLPADAAGL